MKRSLIELAEDLRTAPNFDAFWNRVTNELRNFGVQSLLYGAYASRAEVDTKRLTRTMIFKSNHPKVFFDTFGLDSALDNDLTSQHCIEKQDVFLWHDDREWDNATPAQRKRSRIEVDIGLNVGVTLPASLFTPGYCGGVGLSTPSLSLREFDKMWRAKGAEIIAICGLLDGAMREVQLSAVVGLSPREKECLKWLVAGLRPDEIASRLHIGVKSIEKYIASAKVKMKCATRDQAVAKAIIFKLIEL